MASIITIAGEQLFAQKAQNNQQLDIDTFIFANVPGQDPAAPIDRDEAMPVAGQQVHTQIVQQVGRINDNVVVYSTVLDSVTGDFDFNWVGLYSSVNDTLVAINHIPTTTKTATNGGAAGNTLNRNFGIEYSGIADLTGITVAPETWQLDFTARLAGMDELTRQLASDMNGKDWFIDDGFKIVPRSTVNTFDVLPGVGYVNGLRIEQEAAHILTLQSYPQFIYVDAYFDGDASSVWKPKQSFTVTDSEMNNYIDVNGKQHYVFKLANIIAAGQVNDLRNTEGLVEKLEKAVQYTTVAEIESGKHTQKNINLNSPLKVSDRGGCEFYLTTGETPNGLEIIDAQNGYQAKALLSAPIIDTHVGINQGSGDSYSSLKNAQELAKANDTQVVLTVKGTYRTSKDVDFNAFTGNGWITLDGWTKNNTVNRDVVSDKRPFMVENSEDSHIAGVGNYTAFFGGVAFQGTKLFVARNGSGHISFPTKISKYTVDETNKVTKSVLLDESENEMDFHDFRDPNLSVQRSLSQGPILSGSELTSTPLVYKHYFMKLDVGGFNVESRYDVTAFPSDEFMWGNAVQSPNNHWLKCTYGVLGAKLNNVYLYRATTNGSDPVAWTKIKDPLFENASECTLCYYQDKLVAITRSEPQSNGLQIRWTYDLEGLTGWSESSYLPFTGAAPAVVQYIPEGEPLFLHFSEPDSSTGYRMPSFAATYDLVDWTRQSTGQFKNYTGSGAYGGLVPNGKGSYSTMYYEEVGATEGVTRVWYGSMSLEGRVYPNDSTVRFMYSQDPTLQKSTLLPSGESCLGSPADITELITSNANDGYFEIIPKTDFEMRALVLMLADSTATDVTVTVTENGVSKGVSIPVSVETVTPLLYELPFALAMKTGKTYRFTLGGSVQWYGRKRPKYYNSPFRPIADDYGYYSYIMTNVEGLNFNTFALSHGFKI